MSERELAGWQAILDFLSHIPKRTMEQYNAPGMVEFWKGREAARIFARDAVAQKIAEMERRDE